MAVYVPPKYEKKGGAKAFADKIIDMIEGFVREKRLNQSGRQDLNLRPSLRDALIQAAVVQWFV